MSEVSNEANRRRLGRPRRDAQRLAVRLPDKLAVALDAWTQAQIGAKPSRAEAVRLILTEFLRAKGHLK